MKTLCLTFSLLIASIFCFSQDEVDLALKAADAQNKNVEKLKQYSWKRSIKGLKDGEEKIKKIVQVRFNSEDKMETTVIGQESNIEKKKGIAGKKQQSKMEGTAQFVENTVETFLNYIFLSKGQLIDAYENSEIIEKDGNYDIKGRDVSVKGDQVTFVLNKDTYLYENIEVNTIVDDTPVNGSISFKVIDDGVNHPSAFKINVPEKGMKIIVESFDYIKQK